MTRNPDADRDDQDRTETQDTSSNDKLPSAPNPDDPTPLGDTDQHSDAPPPAGEKDS